MDWWKEMKEEQKQAVMNGGDKDEGGNDSKVGETWKERGGQVWLWDDADKKDLREREEDRRKRGDGVAKSH